MSKQVNEALSYTSLVHMSCLTIVHWNCFCVEREMFTKSF